MPHPLPRTTSAPSAARTLAGLRRLPGAEGPTLGTVADHLSDRAIPLLLLFLGLAAFVPTPGLPVGMITGSACAVVAFSALVRPGESRPALPGWLSRKPLPRRVLHGVLRRAVPLLRWLERRLRPRLSGLALGAGLGLAYGMVVVHAALVALPIPFGNTLPALAIILIALGILARDGLMVLVGHGVGLAWIAILAGVGRWLAGALAGEPAGTFGQ
ncbi:exopolysaccharide biosynthesis protein exod [Rhodospirillum rubrum]|uniref:exopolysaccharide biosynthesis protein n=2 Tax=Rhodospirillum rubrum TaxID=1085 RepID=UPI001908EEFC|nr:exopolysaccharide biosynthesis protein [Rhodospirillum rubrum]MBK1666396.1 exopolysaccharide biosynthesis protein exod [Rhodospirillum rubrum]